MGSQRGSDRPESSSSRSQDIRLVQGAPPTAAAVPKMACDRLFSPDPTNLKPISNSNLSPPFLFGPEVEGIRLNYWGAGRQSMKGRWRPGLCPCPRHRGKRLQRPAPDIPVRPSPLLALRQELGELVVLCVHQLVHAAEDLGRATHHRLHREKVVRPRCAVRLARAYTVAGQWHGAAALASNPNLL